MSDKGTHDDGLEPYPPRYEPGAGSYEVGSLYGFGGFGGLLPLLLPEFSVGGEGGPPLSLLPLPA